MITSTRPTLKRCQRPSSSSPPLRALPLIFGGNWRSVLIRFQEMATQREPSSSMTWPLSALRDSIPFRFRGYTSRPHSYSPEKTGSRSSWMQRQESRRPCDLRPRQRRPPPTSTSRIYRAPITAQQRTNRSCWSTTPTVLPSRKTMVLWVYWRSSNISHTSHRLSAPER